MTRLRWIRRAMVAELRVALMLAMQYRASFIAEAGMALLWIGYTLLPILVVFRFRQEVGEWSLDGALLVLGFFIMLSGLLDSFVSPNLSAVVEQVRTGTLDFVLLKPIDTQLLVSVHRTDPTQLPHVLAGLVVVGVGVSRLPALPGPGEWLLGALLLFSGLLILHGLWTLVVSTSFWFVRVDNLSALLEALVDAGRWPLSFYKGAVRFVLTFLLPVGLMTTWPARALQGLLDAPQVALALGVCLAFQVVSRLVWSLAIRHYSSASS